MDVRDELTMIRPGEGIYSLELAPDATAPSLTRLRVRHADKPGDHPLTLAEIPLTTLELEELARLCVKQAKRARPHVLTVIGGTFDPPRAA
jgi:hypothetical protein